MPQKLSLLTGAGFSRNFGGLLGDQIWSLFFSNPETQKNDSLKKYYLANRDKGYEEIYGEVLDPKNSDIYKYKDIVKNLLDGIYASQETFIQCQQNRHQYIRHTMGRFIGSCISDFFTLNQDLFIEKNLKDYFTQLNGNNVVMEKPQVPHAIRLYGLGVKLPKDVKPIDISQEKSVRYFKLHGSMNWLDSNKGENKVIVGGKNKKSQIGDEPLLGEYHRYFNQSLSQSNYLLVIGYSFNDPHINEIIGRNIKEAKLRVIVIDKLNQERDLLDRMLQIKKGPKVSYISADELWKREIAGQLYGYFPIESIYDLFMSDNTGKASELFKIIAANMEIPSDVFN